MGTNNNLNKETPNYSPEAVGRAFFDGHFTCHRSVIGAVELNGFALFNFFVGLCLFYPMST